MDESNNLVITPAPEGHVFLAEHNMTALGEMASALKQRVPPLVSTANSLSFLLTTLEAHDADLDVQIHNLTSEITLKSALVAQLRNKSDHLTFRIARQQSTLQEASNLAKTQAESLLDTLRSTSSALLDDIDDLSLVVTSNAAQLNAYSCLLQAGFDDFQSFGASMWETFEIDDETYLVLTSYSSVNHTSLLYKWSFEAMQFRLIQSFPTKFVTAVKAFSFNNQTYLALAIEHDTANDTSSLVYLFNPGRRLFEIFQRIATHGARQVAAFVHDSVCYLAFVNRVSGLYYSTYAEIFKLSEGKFASFQNLTNNSLISIEPLSINNFVYLFTAMASSTNASVFALSNLTGTFEPVSSIFSSTGTRLMKPFRINTNTYLITLSEPEGRFELYYVDPQSLFLHHLQTMSILATSVEITTIDDHTYLYAPGPNAPVSYVYRYEATVGQFQEYQQINTGGATAARFITVGTDHYLAIGISGTPGSSQILKWCAGSFFGSNLY